jgi:hypothetical protein
MIGGVRQINPAISSDGIGGAFIIWCDNRLDEDYDIYAQHVSPGGIMQWDENGTRLITAPGSQGQYCIVQADTGVAIAAWHDWRNGYYEAYAGRLKIDLSTKADLPIISEECILYQNTPNPFNPATTVRFDLPHAAHVKLCVYNVKGELVATLVNRRMAEGRKEVSWAAKDNRGRPVSSGVYFYRLVAGEFVQTRKMLLLR